MDAEAAERGTLFVGASQLLTMVGEGAGGDAARLGIVEDGAFLVEGGHVAWLGPRAEAPVERAEAVVELGGRVVLPGLVDPHTHLVFAGDRAADFEARARGESYQAIAARGGGIRTTVRATRAADHDTLAALARPRLERLLAAGVTTVEVKSGYGLSVEAELRQLEVVRRLAAEGAQRLVPTLLLHVVPDEHLATPQRWVDIVRQELLPEARDARLAAHVDVFCDVGAFDPDQAYAMLQTAVGLGFEVKAHAEQLTATGFGVRAASLGALSLEHLEHAGAPCIEAMARSGTRAVLLPTASVFLGDRARPPVHELRAAGVPMALGTDLNPGSSPNFDPWLTGTLACTWYGLTPVESLLGLTVEAARALGLEDGTGTLRVGGPADFAVATVARWEGLLYGLGHRPVAETWIGGVRRA